jgi:hypothetical protein
MRQERERALFMNITFLRNFGQHFMKMKLEVDMLSTFVPAIGNQNK